MKSFKNIFITSVILVSLVFISCSKSVDHTDANYVAGEEALVNKDYKKATENFEIYLKDHPKDASACLYCGFAHYFLHEYYKAINDFTAAIELEPNHADSYNGRAKSYFEIGIFDKAIQDWEKSLELGHENADEIKDKIESAKKRM
ncbi:MAG: tetratricopeptide repeat protein [Ignavibacteria bacterium]|nr:tetratricopeptide repeat protein [Ignavibacteria bacterium]